MLAVGLDRKLLCAVLDGLLDLLFEILGLDSFTVYIALNNHMPSNLILATKTQRLEGLLSDFEP